MKKLLFTLLLCSPLVSYAPPIIIPTSYLPIRTTILKPTDRFILLDTNYGTPPSTNLTITMPDFVDSIVTYLATNSTFRTNTQTNIASTLSSAVILNGYIMTPAIAGANTNSYWIDFGVTNIFGQTNIYAALTATNDINLLGASNQVRWSLLSFNIVALGANRVIYFPTSLTNHFTTNGWTYSGSAYYLVLTNGNEARFTIQTNSTWSVTWATFGQ